MAKNHLLWPRFAVTLGDPAGIGPEVTIKALSLLPRRITGKLVLVGDISSITTAQKITGNKISLSDYNPAKLPGKEETAVIDPGIRTSGRITLGRVSAGGGRAAAANIKKAVELCMNGECTGIVTAPIHKKALKLAGINYPGHTEMLADLSGKRKVAMMLASPELKVVLLSTHLSLHKAIRKVKKDAIVEKLQLIKESLNPDKPIAVCGLNPHASDGGLFGNEEEKEIIPAIRMARGLKIDVVGPFPADTLFTRRIRGNYYAILAMYHDQGLVGIKALSFGNCANITLGLPFIRTSVDHGTAMDIAGKGVADPSSMIFAIKTAFQMAER